MTSRDLLIYFIAYGIMGWGWIVCKMVVRSRKLAQGQHMHEEWKKPRQYLFMITNDFPMDIFTAIAILWLPVQIIIWIQTFWEWIVPKLGYGSLTD